MFCIVLPFLFFIIIYSIKFYNKKVYELVRNITIFILCISLCMFIHIKFIRTDNHNIEYLISKNEINIIKINRIVSDREHFLISELEREQFISLTNLEIVQDIKRIEFLRQIEKYKMKKIDENKKKILKNLQKDSRI